MTDRRAWLAELPDSDLERLLADAGTQLAWPPTPDFNLDFPPAAASPPRIVSWRRPLIAAAVVLIALAAGLALSQGLRDTVAGWFGVQGIQIVIEREPETQPTASPPSALSRLLIGDPIELSAVDDAVSYPVALPDELPPPDGLFLRTLPDGSPMVTAVYTVGDGLPETAETGVGLLFMQFPATTDPAMLVKALVGEYASLTELDVDGAPGYWIEGASQLTILLDPTAPWENPVTRPTGNVLLWERNGVTYRMESALDERSAVSLAESLQPVDPPSS